ncbi:hypothetical protein D3C72_1757370 [compost metagenome]
MQPVLAVVGGNEGAVFMGAIAIGVIAPRDAGCASTAFFGVCSKSSCAVVHIAMRACSTKNTLLLFGNTAQHIPLITEFGRECIAVVGLL